ncbi:hypothetical protein ACUN7V_16585 [Quadrisphaera oryzae]|uniref:hypothetical protein n=1 Tax=Quadrisphaera TaxID=317661 RepID=UPI0016493FC6|nr:hypothetical protein [Quadrisphaera sp. RL12-1S]MBC3760893.1 hypothetical protein [Quadrisphaera sp. RL12-1S]
MPSVSPALLRQLAALAAKRGPDAIRWMSLVAPYLREPETRERVRALTRRWSDARSARTPDARLASEISALVDHATSARADAASAGSPAQVAQAEAWLRRAKALERSRHLLLGTTTPGRADAPRRRQAVERLTPEIERLRAEMLEAMLELGHGGGDPTPRP